MNRIFQRVKILTFSIGVVLFVVAAILVWLRHNNNVKIILDFAENNILGRKLNNYQEWFAVVRSAIAVGIAGFFCWAAASITLAFVSIEQLLLVTRKHLLGVSLFFASLLALLLRVSGLEYVSIDYSAFIEPWTNYLRQNNITRGGGLATIDSNYTAPYLLILGFISYLPENIALAAVKFVSILFDFILSVVVFKTVFFVTKSLKKSFASFCAVLFCPTVFLNSGFWAQCDGIYTTFLILALLFFLQNKARWALLVYGIAFSFKLQSIFILPFIIILYIFGKWKFKDLLFAFIGFFGITAVTWLFGSPVYYWLLALVKQLGGYSELTLNAPTVFGLVNGINNSVAGAALSNAGIIFTASMLAGVFFMSLYKRTTDMGKMVSLYLLSAMITVYFLPHMHERYFYVVEIASIIYAACFPKRWFVCPLIIFSGSSVYMPFLFGITVFDLRIFSCIMLFCVILLSKWHIESVLIKDTATERKL